MSLSDERYSDGDWMVYPETKVKEFIREVIEYIESTPTPFVDEIEKLAGEKLIERIEKEVKE